jgi:hypothetical protein
MAHRAARTAGRAAVTTASNQIGIVRIEHPATLGGVAVEKRYVVFIQVYAKLRQ